MKQLLAVLIALFIISSQSFALGSTVASPAYAEEGVIATSGGIETWQHIVKPAGLGSSLMSNTQNLADTGTILMCNVYTDENCGG